MYTRISTVKEKQNDSFYARFKARSPHVPSLSRVAKEKEGEMEGVREKGDREREPANPGKNGAKSGKNGRNENPFTLPHERLISRGATLFFLSQFPCLRGSVPGPSVVGVTMKHRARFYNKGFPKYCVNPVLRWWGS